MARRESARHATSRTRDRLRVGLRLGLALALVVAVLGAQVGTVAAAAPGEDISDTREDGGTANETTAELDSCSFLGWLLDFLGMVDNDCADTAENDLGGIGP